MCHRSTVTQPSTYPLIHPLTQPPRGHHRYDTPSLPSTHPITSGMRSSIMQPLPHPLTHPINTPSDIPHLPPRILGMRSSIMHTSQRSNPDTDKISRQDSPSRDTPPPRNNSFASLATSGSIFHAMSSSTTHETSSTTTIGKGSTFRPTTASSQQPSLQPSLPSQGQGLGLAPAIVTPLAMPKVPKTYSHLALKTLLSKLDIALPLHNLYPILTSPYPNLIHTYTFQDITIQTGLRKHGGRG